jgi:hypothetical protein
MAGSLLGPVVARLAREQVGGQVEPPAPLLAADPEWFSDRLAAVASERRLALLLCLAHRERTISGLGGLCRFDNAIAAEDLELLGHLELVRRSPNGCWRLCCPSLASSIVQVVDLVMTPRAPKETHA